MSNELKILVEEIQYRLKLTQEQVAEKIGYSRPYLVNAMKNGVEGKILEVVKRTFPEILQYVSGESMTNDPAEPYIKQRLAKKNHSGPFMVPLVPVSAHAGYRHSYQNSDFISGLDYYPIVPGIDPHGAIWRYFQVQGDSMLDFLNDGDYVLASQILRDDWHELKDFLCYVIVTDNLVTVKYVAKRKDELILIPRNEKFPQQAVKLSDVREIWKYRRHIGWNASSPKKFEIKI